MPKIKDSEARSTFEDFRASKLQLNQFCAKHGWSVDTFRKVMKRLYPDEYASVVASKKPKSTRYTLGRNLEYSVRDKLRDHGYYVVRSAQSKTITDLVAIKKNDVLLVQCKRGGNLPKEEWDEIYRLSCELGARALFAERPTGRGVNLWILTGPFSTKSKERFQL